MFCIDIIGIFVGIVSISIYKMVVSVCLGLTGTTVSPSVGPISPIGGLLPAVSVVPKDGKSAADFDPYKDKLMEEFEKVLADGTKVEDVVFVDELQPDGSKKVKMVFTTDPETTTLVDGEDFVGRAMAAITDPALSDVAEGILFFTKF